MASYVEDTPHSHATTTNNATGTFEQRDGTYDTLYASLSYNLPESDLSNEQKSELVAITSRLDIERKEIVYFLCLIDYSKYNPNTKVVFPYKCKQTRDDLLEIKLDSLPNRLKQIVYKFVKLAEHASVADHKST